MWYRTFRVVTDTTWPKKSEVWSPCLPLSRRSPYQQATEAVIRNNNNKNCTERLTFEIFTISSLQTALLALWLRHLLRERKILGLNPPCVEIFPGPSHTSDLKISTPVATLPGAWRYRVSAGTGRPGISILWLGEMESLVCSFYLSVAARKIVWADPSLRYTRMLLGR